MQKIWHQIEIIIVSDKPESCTSNICGYDAIISSGLFHGELK